MGVMTRGVIASRTNARTYGLHIIRSLKGFDAHVVLVHTDRVPSIDDDTGYASPLKPGDTI